MRTAFAQEHDGATDGDRQFGAQLAQQTILLQAYARRLTRGGADAEDLLQDTMLRCWVARDRFELDTNMAAWARTVMRNSFLSARRRDRFRADLPEDALDRLLSVAPNQDHAVALTDLDWALGELPQDQRAAVLLAGEGISIEESAVRLSVPEGTIKSRIFRGRERLRKLTDDHNTPLRREKRKTSPAPEKARRRRDWSGVIIG